MFRQICEVVASLAYAALCLSVAVAVARHYPGDDLLHGALPWLAFYAMGLPVVLFGEC